MSRVDYLYKSILEKAGDRKLVLYGYCEGNRIVQNELLDKGVSISLFVDQSLAKQKVKNVYPPDILKGLSEEYFIIVPMVKHQEIIDKLNNLGYYNRDYVYLGNLQYYVICNEKDHFEDSYGNEIIGCIERSKIVFNGFDSKVIISNSCLVKDNFSLEIRDESEVRIGEGTTLNCRFEVFDRSSFTCGKNCVFSDSGLIQMYDSEIQIGDGFTIENNYTIRALRHSYIEIGNDCMVSYNVNMRTNDGHSIFDIHTGRNINSTEELCKNRKIKIGNHVWIGTNALIMYHTDIASGSIIGAMSMVKSKIPNNCIAAGIPAKVIRKDVAWSRNNNSCDITECGEEYINVTQ